MQTIQLKLREASAVLGVAPKDLQNLVQFGVLQPQRRGRFFVFDAPLLLEAKVAFYIKEALGTSVPLLARFTKEIFRDARKSKSGRFSNVSILSRPIRGKEVVRIEIPLEALATELQAQLIGPESPRNGRGGRNRKGWKEEITRSIEEASHDLKGITEREILDDIKLYRARRRKTPEITVIVLPHSPDPGDEPFCTCAEAGNADFIVTLNPDDFPRHKLRAHGISPSDPIPSTARKRPR